MPAFSNRAKKDLSALPPNLRDRAESLIERLDHEPNLGGKLLGKFKGLRSARLGRSHRVIYRVTDTGVEIVTITMRRDAYR
jgi:mRNA-degrading endonuclease RelE of RelBE toxin-antitoxin system